MSRTTIDDCKEKCPNHFDLAYHAAQRAHQIIRRGDARVHEGDDRAIVLALREVAKGVAPAMSLASENPAVAGESGDAAAFAANLAAPVEPAGSSPESGSESGGESESADKSESGEDRNDPPAA